MTFNFNTISENAIVAQPSTPKAEESIFEKYQRITLEKLDLSISDARGRYEQDNAYANPKPSQNWKVVKQNGEAGSLEETVLVWLKIGIKKAVIGPDGETETKIPASVLVAGLQEMRDAIAGYAEQRDSAEAQAFHAMAIESAMPRVLPRTEGMTAWEYQADVDRYVAV